MPFRALLSQLSVIFSRQLPPTSLWRHGSHPLGSAAPVRYVGAAVQTSALLRWAPVPIPLAHLFQVAFAVASPVFFLCLLVTVSPTAGCTIFFLCLLGAAMASVGCHRLADALHFSGC